jgi:hypothetical protein
MTYENEGDIADIQGDEQKSYIVSKDGKSWPEAALLNKELFRPLTTFFKIFSKYDKAYQDISQEPYNSLFISWLKINDATFRFDPANLQKSISEPQKPIPRHLFISGDQEGDQKTVSQFWTVRKISKEPSPVVPVVQKRPVVIKNQDQIPIYQSNYQK